MKPNYDLQELFPLKVAEESPVLKVCKLLGEFFLGSPWLEKALRFAEKKRIHKNPKTTQEGSLIYAEDDALIFLPDPHGPAIFEKFKEKMQKLEISR